ncbi:hypothetical protein AZI87_14275 [Bdellovibrio bacteriovorus]|uniref:Uncharacterized protein n=1 Tax=Bdellovibrio bacteriovorus TaxID=959 RepID=A0A161QFC3_BDEBC|nr:hypothetical protein [Bdellovibrio bacteriovorus]KYG63567.1 hypothetical protein AZI87_14275 [Bdellovibrio bacteriovorus]
MKKPRMAFLLSSFIVSLSLSSQAAMTSLSSEDAVLFDRSYAFLKNIYSVDARGRIAPRPGIELFKMPTNDIYSTEYSVVIPGVLSWQERVKTTDLTRHFENCVGFEVSEEASVKELSAAEISRRFYSGFKNINAYFNSAKIHGTSLSLALAEGQSAVATEVIEATIESVDRHQNEFYQKQMEAYQNKGKAALAKTSDRVPYSITHTVIYRETKTHKVVGVEYFESSLESTHALARTRQRDSALLTQDQIPQGLVAYGRCTLPIAKEQ